MSMHTAQMPSTVPDTATRQAKINARLSSLWERNLPEISARVSLLDRAAAAAEGGEIAPDLRREATSVAHKLAGSLGMFGHARGSEIARSMEQALESEAPIDAVLLRRRASELRQAIPM